MTQREITGHHEGVDLGDVTGAWMHDVLIRDCDMSGSVVIDEINRNVFITHSRIKGEVSVMVPPGDEQYSQVTDCEIDATGFGAVFNVPWPGGTIEGGNL